MVGGADGLRRIFDHRKITIGGDLTNAVDLGALFVDDFTFGLDPFLVFREALLGGIDLDEYRDDALLLLGDLLLLQIDFMEDLKGSRFVVTNPNAATTCGCGNSFSI